MWGGEGNKDSPAQVWRWERGTEQSPVSLPGENKERVKRDEDGAGQAEPRGGFEIPPKAEKKSPEWIWSSRVESHSIDLDTETQRAEGISWGGRQSSVQQGTEL